MLGDPVVGPPGEEEVGHMVRCSHRLVQLGRGGEGRGGRERERGEQGKRRREEERKGEKGTEKGV